MPIVCIMPMLFVVVYGAYSIYDAYEHNKILRIGMKWSCILVTQTRRERSTTT